jgi:hypothetical protein
MDLTLADSEHWGPLLTYFLQAAGAEMTVRAMGTLGASGGEGGGAWGCGVQERRFWGKHPCDPPVIRVFPLPGPSHVSSLWALDIRILEKHQLEPRLYYLRIKVPLIKFLKRFTKLFTL